MKKYIKLLPTIFALAIVLFAPVTRAALQQFNNGVSIGFADISYTGNQYDNVGYNYSIGSNEITIAQFTAAGVVGNGNEDVWNSEQSNPFNDPLNYGVDAPAGSVTWHEAAQYCNWLTSGNISDGVYSFGLNGLVSIDRQTAINTYGTAYALPTADEWYKAAYYDSGSDSFSLYSSGLSTAPSTNDFNYYGYNASGFKPVWEVGSGAEEQNGTHDMMGNVWEWVEIDATTTNISYGGSAYAAQGYLASDYNNGDGYEWDIVEQENFGFRVVAIPEPSTIGFMAVMGVAVLGIRRIFMV